MLIVPLAAKKTDDAPTAEQTKNASEIAIDRTSSGNIDYTAVKFVNITAGSFPGYGQIHTGMEGNSNVPGYSVFRPDIVDKSGRLGITQSHHISTTQNYQKLEFRELFDAIIPLGYRHRDYQTNAIELVSDAKNSRLTGTTVHRGSHELYQKFEAKLFTEILKRGNELEEKYLIKAASVLGVELEDLSQDVFDKAESLKAEMMYKEAMGVKMFLRMGLQEGGIKEAGLDKGDLLLPLNNVDPRFSSKDELEAHYKKIMGSWDMDRIAGELDQVIDSETGQYLGSDQGNEKYGTEAFRAGSEGKFLSYDRTYWENNVDKTGLPNGFQPRTENLYDTPDADYIEKHYADQITREVLFADPDMSHEKYKSILDSSEYQDFFNKTVKAIGYYGDVYDPAKSNNKYPNSYDYIDLVLRSDGVWALKDENILDFTDEYSKSLFDLTSKIATGKRLEYITEFKKTFVNEALHPDAQKVGMATTKNLVTLLLVFGAGAASAAAEDSTKGAEDSDGGWDLDFKEWLVEQAPNMAGTIFQNAVGAAIVGIGVFGLGLVSTPLAAAGVLFLGAADAYVTLKEYLQNYIIIGEKKGDDVSKAKAILEFLEDVERVIPIDDIAETIMNGIQSATDAVVSLFGEQTAPPVLTAGYSTTSEATDEQKEAWLIGHDGAEIIGNASDNILLHTGYGEAKGGKGDDVLVGILPTVREQGERVGDTPIKAEFNDDVRFIAEERMTLTLDGGLGDDSLITVFGEEVTTIGGNGRDWIFNTSENGVIYGDTIDGVSMDDTDLEDSDNADNIWWWSGTTMMDPKKNDHLKFFGIPLVGGSNEIPLVVSAATGFLQADSLFGGASALVTYKSPIYFDHFIPFMSYVYDDESQTMYVVNAFSNILGVGTTDTPDFHGKSTKGAMALRNFDNAPASMWGAAFFADLGTNEKVKEEAIADMGMVFKNANPVFPLANALALGMFSGLIRVAQLVDQLLGKLAAAVQYAKALDWADEGDPLILDLDGDGIETIDQDDGQIYFDLDQDFFAERTGWLSGDDGFLALDKNGNQAIDDISELFGHVGLSGLSELAQYDSNQDGQMDALDDIYAELLVWRDVNQDGQSQTEELSSLADMGIVSISLEAEPLDVVTPQGTVLDARTQFEWQNGTQGYAFDAVFEQNDVDTRYLGETGQAPWLGDQAVASKGFGTLTDLTVAMSNDFELAQAVRQGIASVETPKLRTLVEASGDVLGKWGATQNLTRELTAVLLSDTDQSLLDRAIYVEPEEGTGYWVLDSGRPVLDAQGNVIEQPSFEEILSQTPDANTHWQMEQVWSPSSRTSALQHREEAPYLVQIVDGRALVLDYGIQQADGSWQLASGEAVLDASGQTIAHPTKHDILAQAAPAETEWRVEAFGFNPNANIDVETIGVNMVDGLVTDYSVKVTDKDGDFYVWARNLDRALELQFRDGDALAFNLRNYEIDFDTLDEVDSSDDSTYRVERLTPAQFQFATALSGIEFQPAMLQATVDSETGKIQYSVNNTGDISLADDFYQSGISPMIDMVGVMMEQYIHVSRAFAVRMAMQTGLTSYFDGVQYEPETDTYTTTTDALLSDVFKAIFAEAPTADGADAVVDYLKDWNEILWQVYPDFHFKESLSIDQRTIFQMMLPAYESIDIGLDLPSVMYALSIDRDLLIQHGSDDTEVDGTGRSDFIYLSEGNQTYRGGKGRDVYFVGKNFGEDVIADVDLGDADELRFTDITSKEVIATRDEQDLILTFEGREDRLTIKNHFLGEMNGGFGRRKKNTEMKAIVFADGVVWQAMDIAKAVVRVSDDDDLIVGSGSLDLMIGGKGNDVLRGEAGGDYYVYSRGDGQDVIEDNNIRGNDPFRAEFDFLEFSGDIDSSDLHLTRDGESDDLKIILKDDDGNLTSDSLLIKGQFAGTRLNLDDFMSSMSRITGAAELGEFDFDFISHRAIEVFLFENGNSLDEPTIRKEVIRNASTDEADAIYGFDRDDVLEGGLGNDLMTGRAGADQYIYSIGDGLDVVEDGDKSIKLFGGGDGDTVTFKDLNWADFEFLREGASDTLTLSLNSGAEGIILNEFTRFEGFQGYINLIENFAFADGTRWSAAKLLQHYIDIAKTDGDDHIYGFRMAESLDGGLGNDTLEGGAGSDSYVYRYGDGNDTILDVSGGDLYLPKTGIGLLDEIFAKYHATDKVVFRGINLSEVTFSRTGLDLIITMNNGESVTIQNQYVRANQQSYAVENFVFDDQTISFTQVNPEDLDRIGTSASEELHGSDFAEIIDGKGGDDTLMGASGGDTYLFDVGYGHDTIIDVQERVWWRDRTGKAIEQGDTVKFGSHIERNQVSFTKAGEDLLVTLAGFDDSLRIKNHFRDITDNIEFFEFADGSRLTSKDVAELLQIEAGNFADNRIEGLEREENILDGREGDDTLVGGRASDTYVYGIGYDFDVIEESTSSYSNAVDRVVFGKGIVLDSLIVKRNLNDLVIDLGDGENVLTIKNGLSNQPVDVFEFSDGSQVTLTELIAGMLLGTEGDDYLQGFDSDDVLAGGQGSDALEGGKGNDTYHYGYGGGQDSIYDAQGVDKIVFKEGVTQRDVEFEKIGNDLLIKLAQTDDSLIIFSGATPSNSDHYIESFEFSDGTALSIDNVLYSLFEKSNWDVNNYLDNKVEKYPYVLAPGKGFDSTLLKGNAEYNFSAGDGIDFVDNYYGRYNLKVNFKELSSTDVEVRYSTDDTNQFSFNFASTGDRLVVNNVNYRFSATFSDGVEWGEKEILDSLIASQSTDHDDIVYGTDGINTVSGGKGNDHLIGQDGNDTYLFNKGDGHDIISDRRGNDVLEIKGYRPDEVVISRPVQERNEIVLSFVDESDSVTLRYDGSHGVESVQFSDGTSWTKEDLFARSVGVGSDISEVLVGESSNNELTGLKGNDTLKGEGGDDTYIIGYNDGNDLIVESSGSNDTLYLIETLPEEISLAVSGSNIVITLPSGSSITLQDQLNKNTESHVESVLFSDGTIWNKNQLIKSLRADQIESGFMLGNYYSDEYYYSKGDGVVSIYDKGSSSYSDKLILKDILSSEVSFHRTFGKNLFIDVLGSDDLILLQGFLRDDEYQIEYIEFSDGEILGVGDVIQRQLQDDKQTGYVRGSKWDDHYDYHKEHGSIVIHNNSYYGNNKDVLNFSDLTSKDIYLSKVSDDLIIYQYASDDTVTIVDFFDDSDNWIGKVKFSDSVVWDTQDLRHKAMEFRDGIHYIEGSKWNDYYEYRKEYGSIVIYGYDSSHNSNNKDVLNFSDLTSQDIYLSKELDDLVISQYASDDTVTIVDFFDSSYNWIEEIKLSDGVVWDAQDLRHKAMELRGGIHYIEGSRWNDYYEYRKEHGSIVIYDYDSSYNSNNKDVLNFSDLTSKDIYLSKELDDLVVSQYASDDTVRIVDFFYDSANWIEEVKLSDGVVWDAQDLRHKATEFRDGIHYIEGSKWNDYYEYRKEHGSIVIHNNSYYGYNKDVLNFSDLTSKDIYLSKELDDLVISQYASDDTVRIVDFFDDSDNWIEEVKLSDDVVWDAQDLRHKATEFREGIHYIEGSKWNDYYEYRKEHGSIVIYDYDSSYNSNNKDVLNFSDLTSQDIYLSKELDDLVISQYASDDTVRIVDFFDDSANWIEEVKLSDGVVWDAQDLRHKATEFRDGIHYIEGSKSNDYYDYRKEHGSIVIYDYDSSYNSNNKDVLNFSDLTSEDIYLSNVSGDLVISQYASDDTVTIVDFFDSSYNWVEEIKLSDGVVWDTQDLRHKATELRDGINYIEGSRWNDYYDYRKEHGSIVIYDYDYDYYSSHNSNNKDVLNFSDLTSEDIYLSNVSGDLVISQYASDDTVTIVDFFDSSYNWIEEIKLSDGVVWDTQDLRHKATELRGGIHYIEGSKWNDYYEYRKEHGSIVIHNNSYYGNNKDVLNFSDLTSQDIYLSKELDDLVISQYASDDTVTIVDFFDSSYNWIEEVKFSDGVVWDTQDLRHKATEFRDGINYVEGSKWNDYYDYRKEHGSIVIHDHSYVSNNKDVLNFSDLTSEDIYLSNVSGDLVISQYASDDTVTIVDFFDSSYNWIEEIKLSDGVVWDTQDLRHKATELRDGINYIEGSRWNDYYDYRKEHGSIVIYDYDSSYNSNNKDALNFSDLTSKDIYLSNVSDDLVISQYASDDTVTIVDFFDSSYSWIEEIKFSDGVVWGVQEIINQSHSKDYYIFGSQWHDDYFYSREDGIVFIEDYSSRSSNSKLDTLTLSDVVLDDVQFIKEGFNLSIYMSDTASLHINNIFYGRGYRIEEFIFSDGQILSYQDVLDRMASNSASGDLEGAASEGNDYLVGMDAEDVLEGMTGNDTLLGGAGNDTYLFKKGDGQDTYQDRLGSKDKVIIQGYLIEDVVVSVNGIDGGPDLILNFKDSDDQIRIIGGSTNTSEGHIETFEFSDSGESYSVTELWALIQYGESTDEDDYIYGNSRNNTLSGGQGDDRIAGRNGADTYLYAKGDGDDWIEEHSTDKDTLKLLDYTEADIQWVMRAGKDTADLVIRFNYGKDRITLSESLMESGYGTDYIEFADGVVWDKNDFKEQVVHYSQTYQDDNLYGFDGNDYFVSGEGDDTFYGGQGSDRYRIDASFEGATISDDYASSSDQDVIEFADLISSEVSVRRLYKGSDTLVFSFLQTDYEVTVNNALAGDGRGIERYQFSDGVNWTVSDLTAKLDNNAPVAVADGFYSLYQDASVVISATELLANDYDADGDTLRVISVNGGEHGDAQINADGNIVYQSEEGFTGSTYMTYSVSDGANGIATGTIDIRVQPQAVAADDTGLSMEEDSDLIIPSIRLLANDGDGDRLLIGSVTNAAHGTVSITNNGDISFTPDQNFHGTASFDYVANTPEGGKAQATVLIEVTPVNDAPVSYRDYWLPNLNEGDSLILTSDRLLRNDRDVDGDALSIVSVSGNGDISATLLDDGSVELTSVSDYYGRTWFEYTIADADGLTSTTRDYFYVEPINDAPIAVEDSVSLVEDDPITINVADLLLNDFDPDGDSLLITEVKNATHNAFGRFGLLENNTILFTPEENYYGEASFEYVLEDSKGATSIGRVNLDIAAVQDNPEAGDDSYFSIGAFKVPENVPIVMSIDDLLKNDKDVDGDSFEFLGVDGAENGEVVLNGSEITFTPDLDFDGEARFYYHIKDETGLVDSGRVTLFFENTIDVAPTAENDTVTVYEDTPVFIPFATLIENDIDLDGDPIDVTGWSLLSPKLPPSGTIIQLSDGFMFTPDANVTESYGFYYHITDHIDGTGQGIVYFEFIPVNDDPVAVLDTVQAFTGVPVVMRIADLLANDQDVDEGDVLSFEQFMASDLGELSYYGDDFVVFTPTVPSAEPITLSYEVSDLDDARDQGDVTIAFNDYQGLLLGSEQRDLLMGIAGQDTLQGFAGEDDLYGEAGDDVLSGGEDADRLEGGEGFDIAVYEHSSTGVKLDLVTGIGQGGEAQGDRLFSIEGVQGSHFNDWLYGDELNNTLIGGEGHDELDGRDGQDTIQAGLGNDTIWGSVGGDLIQGGDGLDTLDYSRSEAAISVNLDTSSFSGGMAEGDSVSGIENIIGTNDADQITGDAMDNLLNAGRGDDALQGGAGNDTLIGGQGADTLAGGDGLDWADYHLSSEGVRVDLAANLASEGDAEGDQLLSIEAIQGSYHDDYLLGDDENNLLRGGEGADVIDGRGGVDTLDYSQEVEGISVDLESGVGSVGAAKGDLIENIENVIGTAYDDHIVGTHGDNVLLGGLGDDLLHGGLGSDTYRYADWFDNDVISEGGDSDSLDKIQFTEGVLPKDVSLIQQDQDLVIQIENQDGIVTNSITVTNHFQGAEDAIESIEFADGSAWGAYEIAHVLRNGDLNAADDLYLFAKEDTVHYFDLDWLLANDGDVSDNEIQVVSVANVEHSVVEIVDNAVKFVGEADHNGDSWFSYTIRDKFGRESTAKVEVNLAPVNDAPIGVDDQFSGLEDQVFRFTVADLVQNDIDIDGDALSVSGLFDVENGKVKFSNGAIVFTPTKHHYGHSGFSYTVSDGAGGTSTATVDLYLEEVNDAPEGRNGNHHANATVNQWQVIKVSSLLKQDWDPEGHDFTFDGLAGLPVNGLANLIEVAEGETVEFDGNTYDESIITFRSDTLGEASFGYQLTDELGASNVITVDVDVLPPNRAPNAKNDKGFTVEEDQILTISVDRLLANDSDPDGDEVSLLSVEHLAVNGKVSVLSDNTIQFTPDENYNGSAGFYYDITDHRGGEDRAYVSIDVIPYNNPPYAHHDVLQAKEDIEINVIPGDIFGNDGDIEGDVVFLNSVRTLGFVDAGTARSGEVSNYSILPTGVGASSVSATINSGQTLPDWLVFDEDSYQVSVVEPDAEAEPVRFVLTFTSTDPMSQAIDYHSYKNTYQLSVDVDPNQLDPQINTFLSSLKANGISAFESVKAHALAPTLVNGQSLPGWLAAGNDAYTLSGIAPPEYVGTLNLETDFSASEQAPAFTLTSELVVDEGFNLKNNEVEGRVSVTYTDDSMTIHTPEDFYGPIALAYTVVDTKGKVSEDEAIVVINVEAQRELPDALEDHFSTAENEPLTIVLDDLLANDFDDDGDAIRLVSIEEKDWLVQQDEHTLLFTPPADAFGAFEFTYTITDDQEGTATGLVTVDVISDDQVLEHAVEIKEDAQWSMDLAALLNEHGVVQDESAGDLTLSHPSHGSVVLEAGQLQYQPHTNYVGEDAFSLTFTNPDGHLVTLAIPVNVLDDNDRPKASDDNFVGVEDTPVVIDIATLLANDRDPNSEDTLTFTLSKTTLEHATVSDLGDGRIQVSPQSNYVGQVAVGYTVSDGRKTDTGYVYVDFQADNDAPTAGADHYAIAQSQSLSVSVADLLANDSDVEGDSFSLTGIAESENGTAVLQDGNIVFTPKAAYFGNASFDYIVEDAFGAASQGHVEVQVLPGDSTVMLSAPYSDRFVEEDSAFSIAIQQDIVTSTEGASLSFSVSQEDGSALPDWLTFDAEAMTLAGTPPADFFGEVPLRITITDGISTVSDVFDLNVTNQNDAPVLAEALSDVTQNDDGSALSAGAAFLVSVDTSKFTDVDDDALSFALQQANGSPLPSWMAFDGQTLSGLAPSDAPASMALTLLASDGAEIVSGDFSLTFAPAEDVPADSTPQASSMSANAFDFSALSATQAKRDESELERMDHSSTNAKEDRSIAQVTQDSFHFDFSKARVSQERSPEVNDVAYRTLSTQVDQIETESNELSDHPSDMTGTLIDQGIEEDLLAETQLAALDNDVMSIV